MRRVLAGVAAAVAVVLPAAPAQAAPGDGDRRVGYDVSYPQCGDRLPDDAAFAVVGVNGGLPTVPNPCLPAQLRWAAGSTGDLPGQPRVQLYLNTANPGEVRDRVSTWPRTGDTPYGVCDGSNSTACSWAYGRARARVAVHGFLLPGADAAGLDDDPAGYTWWLDVETANSWQSGSPEARERNRATLEGMAAHLQGVGAEVGLYSTAYQWRLIAGTVGPSSPLYRVDSWLAGAQDEEQARDWCDRAPLTGGGDVTLVQYVEDDLDHDVACGTPAGRTAPRA